MRTGLGAALILLVLANLAGASTSIAQTPANRNDPEPGVPWLEIAMAVEGVDAPALLQAADPNSEEQRKLVSAIELAWLRRDAEAAAALRASADTAHSRGLRLEALNMLMAVDHPSCHGVLGQDFLRQGFTVDFDAMTFDLTPRRVR